MVAGTDFIVQIRGSAAQTSRGDVPETAACRRAPLRAVVRYAMSHAGLHWDLFQFVAYLSRAPKTCRTLARLGVAVAAADALRDLAHCACSPAEWRHWTTTTDSAATGQRGGAAENSPTPRLDPDRARVILRRLTALLQLHAERAPLDVLRACAAAGRGGALLETACVLPLQFPGNSAALTAAEGTCQVRGGPARPARALHANPWKADACVHTPPGPCHSVRSRAAGILAIFVRRCCPGDGRGP